MSSLSRPSRGSVPSRLRAWIFVGAGLLATSALNAQSWPPGTSPWAASNRSPANGGSVTVVGTAARPTGPNVFGTIALPAGTTQMSARWTRIMAARVDEPALGRLTADAQTLAPQQQAAYVQTAVNHAVHRVSRADCRFDDGYWAAADETLLRGQGDCVDIAVAKMEALRRLGFSGSNLYLTTGRMVGSGLKAALLVRIGERFWLLDDQSEQIVEASRAAFFNPTLTYGVGMTWAHGRPYLGPTRR